MTKPNEDPVVTVDWVESKLQELQQDSVDIWSERSGIVNDFKEWSAIKLIVLAGVVDIYTSIIPNYFDNFYYIDGMAGSGIASIGSSDDRFVGSPILTPAIAHECFDHMYLIEMDSDKADALRQRMEFVCTELDYGVNPDDYTVYEADANEKIPEIIEDLKEILYETGSVHALAFLDNEGPDIKWDTVNKLTSIYTDLLINFPSQSLQRMAGVPNKKRLNEFYGHSRWRSAGTDSDKLRTIYEANLSDAGRPVSDHCRVEGSKNYFYDMIYATRETEGGSPYMKAFDHLEERVSELHGDDVELVLRYMRGEAVDFTPFPGPDPNQSGLGDFI